MMNRATLMRPIGFLFTVWCAIIAAIGVSVAVENVMPSYEGQRWPVVELAQISRIEVVSPYASRVWLESEKLRGCSYDNIEWFLGEQEGEAARVPVTFEEKSKIRGPGPLSLGPWLVALPPEQIMDNSFAFVNHNCHVFWQTKSLFYDSAIELSPLPKESHGIELPL